jgi:hypothetical protein
MLEERWKTQGDRGIEMGHEVPPVRIRHPSGVWSGCGDCVPRLRCGAGAPPLALGLAPPPFRGLYTSHLVSSRHEDEERKNVETPHGASMLHPLP